MKVRENKSAYYLSETYPRCDKVKKERKKERKREGARERWSENKSEFPIEFII